MRADPPRQRMRERRGVWVVGAVVALTLLVAPGVRAAEPSPRALDGGLFFAAQTAGAGTGQELGFSVTDDRGFELWSAYRRLGGAEALGAPVSRRFLYAGAVVQLFERGLLRWEAEPRRASLLNVFDDLSLLGFDDRLRREFGVPPSADWAIDRDKTWAEIRANHLRLLDGPEAWRGALRDAFFQTAGAVTSPDAAIALNGLPMGIERTADGYVLRAQRAVFAYDPARDVTARRLDLAVLLRAMGLLPEHALTLHGADERPHLRPKRPTFAVHFFDWWRGPNLPAQFFTHNITWERIGITPAQIGSPAYYDANFRLIKELGADGVIWEWYAGADLTPSPVVIDALAANELKIGMFYDWELVNSGGTAILSDSAYIAAEEASLGKIASEVVAFYRAIPRGLWLFDADGRLPVVVYGYGFPERIDDPTAWAWFFSELVRRVEAELDVDVVFDWSAAYLPPSQVQEFAFERWADSYKPFNFVVDLPQPQFGTHVVTWNFIFDNRGVAQRDRLPRVVRDDNRYLQETQWLATHTSPSLVFLYSWNELWEGSHLLPDDTYGWRRFDLARAMIASVATDRSDDLPHAAVIIDRFDAYLAGDHGLFENERRLLRHYLRRYAPQAVPLRADQLSAASLAGFDLVISLTTDRRADAVLAALPARVRIVYWNATEPGSALARRFVGDVVAPAPLGHFRLLRADGTDTGSAVTAEGDALSVAPAPDATPLFFLDDNGRRRPVLLQAGNDFWINLYAPSDILLEAVFERVYGRALEPGITFALGAQIQRLEIYPDGRVVQNRFEAPAVFRHDPLPIPDFQPVPPAGV